MTVVRGQARGTRWDGAQLVAGALGSSLIAGVAMIVKDQSQLSGPCPLKTGPGGQSTHESKQQRDRVEQTDSRTNQFVLFGTAEKYPS